LTRFGADRLQNPHRFHHRAAAGRVVGGAGGVRVRVEVSAKQNNLRRQVGTRNVRDRVEAVWLALVVELCLDVELDLHWHILVEHSDHAVVMLDGESDDRHALAGLVVTRAGAVGEDRPAIGMLLLPGEVAAAGRHVAVAAAIEHSHDAFLHVEVVDLLPKHCCRAAAAAAARRRGHRRRLGLRDVPLGHAQDDGAFEHPHAPRRLREDDLARELAVIPREIGLACDLHPNHVGGHGTFGARRPLLREPGERLDLRLDHVRGEADERPSLAEGPAFLVNIGQPPFAELLHRPLARLLIPGDLQARPVDIAESRDGSATCERFNPSSRMLPSIW
jgi:hypothetical protein